MFVSSMIFHGRVGGDPVVAADTMGGGAAGLWNVTSMTSARPVHIPLIPDSADNLVTGSSDVTVISNGIMKFIWINLDATMYVV